MKTELDVDITIIFDFCQNFFPDTFMTISYSNIIILTLSICFLSVLLISRKLINNNR